MSAKRPIIAAASLLFAGALTTCSRQQLVDTLVSGAFRPGNTLTGSTLAPPPTRGKLLLLAGDMHCHVSPPDDTSDVSRGLPETLELARKEKLDFVVLTPHVASRFFMHPTWRHAVAESQAELRTAIAQLQASDVVFIPGFEYTDHRYGHLSVSFADLDSVLGDVSVEEAQKHPEAFFERWVARGGLLVVNHPMVIPLDSFVPMARYDLSWRPFTSKGPFPPEIERADELAQGFEAYNLAATELRDRWLLGDSDVTLHATFAALDERSAASKRRMTPVGGSDSHGHHLRAATYVLAEAKTPESIRAAIGAGRTCVRDPTACSFEVRADEGPWAPVGTAFESGRFFDVRATGDDIEVYLDGKLVASPESGAVTRVVPGSGCSVLRARVGEGYSAPVYIRCALTGS